MGLRLRVVMHSVGPKYDITGVSKADGALSDKYKKA